MTTDQILALLRLHEAPLRDRGVEHAALFGSLARGEARDDSDIDILVSIAQDAPVGVYEYAGIKTYIASLFDASVDVVDADGLKPQVRSSAAADAIYAF